MMRNLSVQPIGLEYYPERFCIDNGSMLPRSKINWVQFCEILPGDFMSRTITISDELYASLEAEAHARGLNSIEHLLEEREQSACDLSERQRVVKRIDDLRERLFIKYGEMPDSVELLRADRNR
jgi:hypothetical protein